MKNIKTFGSFINESINALYENSENTLADILDKKGSLDDLKTDRIRLKLIDDGPFLKKNPDWKNKPVKFLFYSSGMVGVELIGSDVCGNAYPSELVIDTEATNSILAIGTKWH